MLNVVLVNPEIPPNTGNIGRLCCAVGARLHLIQPLGFSLDDRYLKRAGLDYWDKLDLEVWNDLDAYLASVSPLQIVSDQQQTWRNLPQNYLQTGRSHTIRARNHGLVCGDVQSLSFQNCSYSYRLEKSPKP